MPDELALALFDFLACWCLLFSTYVIVIFSADSIITNLKRRRDRLRLDERRAAVDLEVAASLRQLAAAFNRAQHEIRAEMAGEVRSQPADKDARSTSANSTTLTAPPNLLSPRTI